MFSHLVMFRSVLLATDASNDGQKDAKSNTESLFIIIVLLYELLGD